MSYDIKQGVLAYFMPNIPVADTECGVIQEIDVGASSADHGEYVCFRPCIVSRLAFAVTGEAVSGTSVAPTVVFTKRPTPLSSSGEAVVGTLTLPTGTAIGKVVYKDLAAPVRFRVGDSMELAHTIGTGTPTGMGVAFFECQEDPEYSANMTDMVASA